jgi:electron transfer flavoprotein alpha/beta subunit
VWSTADLGLDASALQPRAQQLRYQALPVREGTVEMIEGATAQEKAAKLVDKLIEEKVL